MLKKTLNIILGIIVFLILCVFQLYLFNNWYIWGVRFDAIAVFVIVHCMMYKLTMSLIVAGIVGIVTDLLFGYNLGEYLVIYMVVVLVLESLKQIYKQDTKWSVAIYLTAGMFVIEVLTVLYSLINVGVAIGIVEYIFAVIKTILLNIPLAYGLYIIIAKLNEKMEK